MNIFCPNCETGCPEETAVCPKCGHPLEEEEQAVQELRPAPRERERGAWWWRFGAALAFALASVWVLWATVENLKAEYERCKASLRASGEAREKVLERRKTMAMLIMKLAKARGPGFERLTYHEANMAAAQVDRIRERYFGLDLIPVCEVVAGYAGTGLTFEQIAMLCLAEAGGEKMPVVRVQTGAMDGQTEGGATPPERAVEGNAPVKKTEELMLQEEPGEVEGMLTAEGVAEEERRRLRGLSYVYRYLDEHVTEYERSRREAKVQALAEPLITAIREAADWSGKFYVLGWSWVSDVKADGTVVGAAEAGGSDIGEHLRFFLVSERPGFEPGELELREPLDGTVIYVAAVDPLIPFGRRFIGGYRYDLTFEEWFEIVQVRALTASEGKERDWQVRAAEGAAWSEPPWWDVYGVIVASGALHKPSRESLERLRRLREGW